MVGDGATDLEAKQDGGADMFVGYVKLFPFHSKLGLWEISNVSFPTCFFWFLSDLEELFNGRLFSSKQTGLFMTFKI